MFSSSYDHDCGAHYPVIRRCLSKEVQLWREFAVSMLVGQIYGLLHQGLVQLWREFAVSMLGSGQWQQLGRYPVKHVTRVFGGIGV